MQKVLKLFALLQLLTQASRPSYLHILIYCNVFQQQ